MKRDQGGPRIYNLFPTLLGSVDAWQERLPVIAGMGFDWIFLNPFQYPGFSGSLYAVKDYYRLHPVVRGNSDEPPDERLRRFVVAAGEAGISVMMDLVVNHTAKDSGLVEDHPDWYLRNEEGDVRSPFAVDPDDPDAVTVWEDLAELDYSERPARAEMLAYWDAVVSHYVGLGFQGFRCDAAYKVPGEVWEELIGAARGGNPHVTFFAETLGAQIDEVDQLRPAGFDYFFNSAKWWDFRADWLLDQYEQFRHLAPSVAFPESHDTKRVAAESGGSERESRFRYLFAAFFSSGVMMPIGYELGFRRPLHVVKTRPEDWEEPAFDLTDYVAAVNRMKADTPALNQEGPQVRFTAPDAPLVGLVRRAVQGAGRATALINPDPEHNHDFPVAELAAALESESAALREITPFHEDPRPGEREHLRVEPRSSRVFTSAE
ncbi:MAG: alpha-amylase family glycosyl hydrolase [Chromatiaceae bacterium]|jgi:starch synthase (maltosyl-transferring)